MREIKKIRLALLTIMRAVFANYVRIMHVIYKVIYYICLLYTSDAADE